MESSQFVRIKEQVEERGSTVIIHKPAVCWKIHPPNITHKYNSTGEIHAE